MFPPETSYDQAARYVLRQAPPELLLYRCGLKSTQAEFFRWFDSVVMFPGTSQRICDAIAVLNDTRQSQEPFACLVEFQSEPDPDMFDRLMVAGGLFRKANKPSGNPGDRYNLAFLVINLTGRGLAAREMKLGEMVTTIVPREWNLQYTDAKVELANIEKGKAPMEWLTFIPLMQNAGQEDIISRWKDLADKVTDPRKRQTLSLAAVFAADQPWHGLWKKAMEDFSMLESSMVRQWKDEARSEGERKGKQEGERKGKADVLIRLLKLRFKSLPEELIAAINQCEDLALLESWADEVVLAKTLKAFRTKAKI